MLLEILISKPCDDSVRRLHCLTCPRARSTFSSIRASASRIEARVCSTLGPSDAAHASSPGSSATLASWASCSASCRASWKSCSSASLALTSQVPGSPSTPGTQVALINTPLGPWAYRTVVSCGALAPAATALGTAARMGASRGEAERLREPRPGPASLGRVTGSPGAVGEPLASSGGGSKTVSCPGRDMLPNTPRQCLARLTGVLPARSRPDRATQTIRRRPAAPHRRPAHRHPASSSPASQRARPKRPGSLRRPLRDCPWAYAHPEKCVERLAPTWIRHARARRDSLRVPPGYRRSREPAYAML
jgi:hypothetical protein